MPYGTPVYYCYQIENTGNVTMTVHSLVDDQLGTLANNLAYVLPARRLLAAGHRAGHSRHHCHQYGNVDRGQQCGLRGQHQRRRTTSSLSRPPAHRWRLTDDSEANIAIPWGATFFGVHVE